MEIHPYLNPSHLASVKGLQLRARLIVEGVMAGMHRSPHQGFSVEFAQHRQYAAGDDIRHLDWKVFGRTDKLYLKQYQQETSLDLVMLVDVSSSMGFTSQSKPPWCKFDYAASLAVAMAYLALQQQDRVGLILFDEHLQSVTRQSSSQDHWRAMVEMLSGVEIDRAVTEEPAPTNLGRVFEETLARLTQRSLIVLISDLFDDPDQLERALAQAAHRRHDVIVFQVLDPAEITFPYRQLADFVGLEGEGKVTLDPSALRRAYLKSLNKHLEKVRVMTRRFHFDYLKLNTGEPLGPTLSHFLAQRGASLAKQTIRR